MTHNNHLGSVSVTIIVLFLQVVYPLKTPSTACLTYYNWLAKCVVYVQTSIDVTIVAHVTLTSIASCYPLSYMARKLKYGSARNWTLNIILHRHSHASQVWIIHYESCTILASVASLWHHAEMVWVDHSCMAAIGDLGTIYGNKNCHR